jgi:hypothetical protein
VIIFPCPMRSLWPRASSPRSAGPIRQHDHLLAHGLRRSCVVRPDRPVSSPFGRSREKSSTDNYSAPVGDVEAWGRNGPRDACKICLHTIHASRQAWPGHRRFAEHATCMHAWLDA